MHAEADTGVGATPLNPCNHIPRHLDFFVCLSQDEITLSYFMRSGSAMTVRLSEIVCIPKV